MSSPRHRVLLVEDNPDNQYLATLLLEQEGYEVVAVPTGQAALETLGNESFMFVLLDLQLPDLDGYEVVRQIRGNPRLRDMPVIAVSAFAMAADRRNAYAAGCTGYLEKPIDADAFVAQVRCLAGVEP
jgi:CheY-like chemotaxis protein